MYLVPPNKNNKKTCLSLVYTTTTLSSCNNVSLEFECCLLLGIEFKPSSTIVDISII